MGEETKQMDDNSPFSPKHEVEHIVAKFIVKYGIKQRSPDCKLMNRLKENALEKHPDLNNQTPKQFAQSVLVAFSDQVPLKAWR